MTAAKKERLQQLCGRFGTAPKMLYNSQGLLCGLLGAHVHSLHLLIGKGHESERYTK